MLESYVNSWILLTAGLKNSRKNCLKFISRCWTISVTQVKFSALRKSAQDEKRSLQEKLARNESRATRLELQRVSLEGDQKRSSRLTRFLLCTSHLSCNFWTWESFSCRIIWRRCRSPSNDTLCSSNLVARDSLRASFSWKLHFLSCNKPLWTCFK
jgi:hypothetical protein